MKSRGLRIISLMSAIVLLFCSGCSDKKEKNNPFETNETTQYSPKTTEIPEVRLRLTEEERARPAIESDAETFLLQTTEGNTTFLMDLDGHIEKKDADSEKILCLVLAESDSIPATAQLPYLSDLVETNDERIECTALLLDDNISAERLEALRNESPELHFAYGISTRRFVRTLVVDGLQYTERYPIPMTLLYRSGKLLRHYEGEVPYEMIAHDVATILHTQGVSR